MYKQGQVKPDHFYLYISRRKDFDRIKKYLRLEFGSDNVVEIKNTILQVLDSREDLLNIGLGISKADVKLVESYGFKPIYRLKNTTRLNSSLISSKISSFYSNTNSSYVLFDGDSALGYPVQLDFVKEKFEDKQIRFGVVEFLTKRYEFFIKWISSQCI